MLPSLLDEYLHEEMAQIHHLGEKVRYGTDYEVPDLLKLSCAYEKLALRLLGRGLVKQAFLFLADAARCCTASYNNWTDTEWGEILCKPLRGRFFAVYSQCKDLVRQYPALRYAWEASGLRQTCIYINDPFDVFGLEWDGSPGG